MAQQETSLHRKHLFDVCNAVAVVTGGGTGLGLTIARALAINGAAAVFILGRREDVLEKAAESHKNIYGLQCDVTSKDSLKECAEIVKDNYDGIDILVANAGVNSPECVKDLPKGGRPEKIEDFIEAMWNVPMETFDQALKVNVTSAFYTALAFLPLLHKRNQQRKSDATPKPQILITSSIGGLSRIVSGRFAYCASKAAVIHLAKQLATYLSPWQIRVNTLAPGLFATEMTADRGGADMSTEGSVKGDVIPLERWGTEDEIAGAALFMLSPAGSYLDGSVMLLDGGRLSVAPSVY